MKAVRWLMTIAMRGVDDTRHAILPKLAWETVSKYPHAGIASLEK